ncbi:MAG: HPF/RaiA family ribosome-associated protein [Phycisphaerae bacterium]|nr:HPF/RaiA family ribosome-associated protein [Phycisphaerae bacterium]
MAMQVFVRGVEDGTGLRQFAEEKLEKSLERFHDHVLDATVRLEDVTGPDKHGIDKLCHIDVRLRSGEVRIKEQGDDFHVTLNTALDRMRAGLSREVAKAKRGIGEG